jgi:hypothetical protein
MFNGINVSAASCRAVTATPQTIIYKPDMSFAKLNGCIHTCKCGTVQYQMEFNNDKRALQFCDSASPKFVYTNLRLFAWYVDVTAEERAKYQSKIIRYNFEGCSPQSFAMPSTSNSVAVRVAAKSANWAWIKYHVDGDDNHCPTVAANPFIKKFVHPDSSGAEYTLTISHGGDQIPQTPTTRMFNCIVTLLIILNWIN